MSEIPTGRYDSPEEKIYGPSAGEAEELNALANAPEEILSPEAKVRSFVNRSLEIAYNFIKHPSKKAKIAIGLSTFIMGLGTWKRDEILDWGAQTLMQNPHVMHYFDNRYSKNYSVLESESLDTVDVDESTISPEIASVEFEGNEINLIDNFQTLDQVGRSYDTGEPVPIEDPYLKNLTQPNYQHVREAADPERFRRFIQENVNAYLADIRGGSFKKDFEEGHIPIMLEIAQYIIDKNLSYDKKTESWLKEGDDGRLSLRWSKANPISSFLSTDGVPVDELLMDKHVGICRHFSDAMCLVVRQIKELYPDKFQNVYPTIFHDAYQWHFYNLVFVVKGPHEADVFALEPQNGASPFVPAYEFLKTLRDRGILPPDKFLDTMKDFLTLDKVHESDVEIFTILDTAKHENRPDVITAVKNYFIHRGDMENVTILRREHLINDREYIHAGVNYLQDTNPQNDLNDMVVEQLMLDASKMNPELLQEMTRALYQMLTHPKFDRMGTMNYQDMVNIYHKKKVISDKQYHEIFESFYTEYDDWPCPEYLDFLISQKEHLPHARAYLVSPLQYGVDYPKWIREDFIDGEFADWDRKTAWEESKNQLKEMASRYKKQLDAYLEATGENLVTEYEPLFNRNLEQLRAYLLTNPKKEKNPLKL